MQPPRDYAAWIIDLDGTLYRHNYVRAMMMIELLLWGRPEIQILRTFRREQERLRVDGPASQDNPFELQIQSAALRLGISTCEVRTAIERWMFERPGRWLRIFRRRRFLGAIAMFRAGGGRTALVSDYPARRKLAAMGAAELFDVVVACGEPNGPSCLKPQPVGLLSAAAQLGVSAADCLVIGDRSEVDGEAARRAGMAFRHINGRWPQ
jgi:FMN phosphatase YigB (HAD superfamily)